MPIPLAGDDPPLHSQPHSHQHNRSPHNRSPHNHSPHHANHQTHAQDDDQQTVHHTPNAPDNSGFEEVAAAIKGRRTTTSIALPSSILNNAQSPDLRMYLAGQVARTACIYRIDEIIVYDEQLDPPSDHRRSDRSASTNFTAFFATVLKYLETPQYLRKHLFPMSSDLRLVGLLNPLALPSHVAKDDLSRWREAVAYSRSSRSRRHSQPQSQPHSQAQPHTQDGASPPSVPAVSATSPPSAPPTRYVDAGLDRLVEVDRPVPSGSRVTIDMSPSGPSYEKAPGKYLFGNVVDRATPAATDATYWGYRVRTARALSDVFSSSPIAPQGYDLTIGTSERGTHISKSGRPTRSFALPEFSHLLIVFGGVHGLERSVKGDAKLEELGISSHSENGGSDVGDLFDFYLNTCPQQGSRTIRTEEAILISMAALQPFLNGNDS